MSKTITAVPESITRDAYVEVVRSLGFDPEPLRSLRFAPDGIYAEVYDTDAQGVILTDGSEDSEHPGLVVPAIQTVFIPVEG